MAKIISAPFGELRGKLGGVVYSRGRYGMFVRQHVMPINPQTTAQVRSRALFADASQAWCTLSIEQKAGWEEFARNPMRFNPLTKVNVGQYTGQAAFISLYTMAARSDDICENNWPSGWAGTNHGYSLPVDAPEHGVDGTIKTEQGNFALVLTAPSLGDNGSYALEFELVGAPPGPLTLPAGFVKDGHGTPFGLGFYISTYVKNPKNRPSQIYFVHAGQGCLKQLSGPTELTQPLVVQGRVNIPGEEYRYGLQADNVVRITAVQVGMYGQVRVLGSAYVTIFAE